MLLSGFIVRTKRVLWFMYPITYGSYFRFVFETILLIMYGFERCKINELDYELKADDIPKWVTVVTKFHSRTMKINFTEQQMNDPLIMGQFVLNNWFPRKSENQFSVLLDEFDLSESDIGFNIMALSTMMIVWLSTAYTIMYYRARRSS